MFIVTKLLLQGFANYRMLSLVPAEPQSFRFCFFLLVLVSKLLAVQTTVNALLYVVRRLLVECANRMS